MGAQDRSYYREQSDHYNPLLWLFAGSMPVFSLAGIRIRVHSSLILFAGLALLMGAVEGYTLPHRLVSIAALVVVLLLHQLAQCLATRGVGGAADEAILWPLGGLGQNQYPLRAGSMFTAVAAGPVMCLAVATLSAGLLHSSYGIAVPTAPGNLLAPGDWHEPQFYLWYLYVVSAALLVVNLLPVLPLDGGHLLHAVLWPAMGYGKSLLATSHVGIFAGIAAGAYGVWIGQWLLICAMIGCIAYCVQKRATIKAAGVWTFDELNTDVRRPRRHRLGRFTKWRARRQIRREEAEQTHVDMILEKIQRHGIHSLSWWERRTLRHATERQRELEMEVGS